MKRLEIIIPNNKISLVITIENDKPLSELGKVEERHGIDTNFYLLPCKVKTGLSSDILQGLRKCTPVEIKNSVVETGSHEFSE